MKYRHFKPWGGEVICGAFVSIAQDSTSDIEKVECRSCLVEIAKLVMGRLNA